VLFWSAPKSVQIRTRAIWNVFFGIVPESDRPRSDRPSRQHQQTQPFRQHQQHTNLLQQRHIGINSKVHDGTHFGEFADMIFAALAGRRRQPWRRLPVEWPVQRPCNKIFLWICSCYLRIKQVAFLLLKIENDTSVVVFYVGFRRGVRRYLRRTHTVQSSAYNETNTHQIQ
jgi:hypothetical protein